MTAVRGHRGSQRGNGRTPASRSALVAALCALVLPGADAATKDGAAAQGEMLLYNHMGQAVHAPLDSVHPNLQPPSAVGLKYQTPNTHKGVRLPTEVLDKLESI